MELCWTKNVVWLTRFLCFQSSRSSSHQYGGFTLYVFHFLSVIMKIKYDIINFSLSENFSFCIEIRGG